ncbi:hypothetical protein ACSAZK_05635 [Methanosarcina sp. Mfa9]|uniref:hypothetical protein n=1 Tax=Methanosarcina sp. Mfa9 TaxID=3439063 RepID=UPI003F84E1E4
MNINRCLRVLALLLIMSSVFMPLASAHRAFVGYFVGADAGDEMQVKAWYEGGSPMANADVSVYLITGTDEGGKDIKELYFEGSTDEDGYCTFLTDRGETMYSIVVEQDGHRARGTIDLENQASSSHEDELPLPARVVAGFGYLIGLAGVGMMISARKMKKQYEKS